jgi:hypothetical protein
MKRTIFFEPTKVSYIFEILPTITVCNLSWYITVFIGWGFWGIQFSIECKKPK